MYLRKSLFAFSILIIGFCSTQINAQEKIETKQIMILGNYSKIPFEDGKTIITNIEFNGFDKVFSKRLLEKSNAAKKEALSIEINDKFYGYKIAKLVKILKKELKSDGYPNPKITVFGEILSENKMKLIFLNESGLLLNVSEIRFEGNKTFSNSELLATMRNCLGDKKIFDANHYKYCAATYVREFAYSRGFLKAMIGKITPQVISDGYRIIIPITEGIVFRYGNIKFNGSSVFTEIELLNMLGQKTGDIVDGVRLRELMFEELKGTYADRGYIEYDAEVIPTFNEKEDIATVDAFLRIDEGSQFKVSSIKIVGIGKEDQQKIKEKFLLKEGEIYNQSKFEQSIERINALKQFAQIDIDLDVETQVARYHYENDDYGKPVSKGKDSEKPRLRVRKENDYPDVKLVVKVKNLK